MIEFEHVYKRYPNGVLGLDDVNLKIDQGEFVAVIGLSGAGKSTLIRTVNRMIGITDGKLTVNGTDVSALSQRAAQIPAQDRHGVPVLQSCYPHQRHQ